jgi:hypothetical protein
MKEIILLIIAGVVVAGCCSTCYTVTLKQIGPNVVATGSGAIKPAHFIVGGADTPHIYPSRGRITTGPFGGISAFENATGPTNFGSGGLLWADSANGDLVGINGIQGMFVVPDYYVPNTPLSGSATWNNVTLASLGVTPGTYVWTWRNSRDQWEENQAFRLIIGPIKWWWWLKPSYWPFHFPESRSWPPPWPPPRDLPRPNSGDRELAK